MSKDEPPRLIKFAEDFGTLCKQHGIEPSDYAVKVMLATLRLTPKCRGEGQRDRRAAGGIQ